MDPDAAGDACSSSESLELDDPTEELLGERSLVHRGEPWPSGTRLRDRYELLNAIGIGGTGIVYRALDFGATSAIGSGRPVAIKLIHPGSPDSTDASARLKLEYRRMASLDDPGIVRAFDIDCDGEHWFIVMEWLQGESLQNVIKRHRAEGLTRAPAIADACIAALAHAHGRGVVHGDVKPANIFLCSDGTVRLLDFAAPLGPASGPLRPMATRAYASPQVLAGQTPTAADDIFSLGCVIYEMTTGRHPFARCASTAARNAGLHAAKPARMSEPNWQPLRRALAWESDARPPDIRRLPGTAEIRMPTAAPAYGPPVPARPSRTPALWLLGLASATAAATWISLKQTDSLQLDPRDVSHSVATAKTAAVPSTVGKPVASSAAAAAIEKPSATELRRPQAAVGFDDRSLRVGEGTRVAALTLRRMDSSRRRVDMRWTIRRGTATPGRDFDHAQTGVLTLARDQFVRVLYIPIVDDDDPEGIETFSVQLESIGSGAAPVGSARTAVVIVDND